MFFVKWAGGAGLGDEIRAQGELIPRRPVFFYCVAACRCSNDLSEYTQRQRNRTPAAKRL
jgi:hypothetical protein